MTSAASSLPASFEAAVQAWYRHLETTGGSAHADVWARGPAAEALVRLGPSCPGQVLAELERTSAPWPALLGRMFPGVLPGDGLRGNLGLERLHWLAWLKQEAQREASASPAPSRDP